MVCTRIGIRYYITCFKYLAEKGSSEFWVNFRQSEESDIDTIMTIHAIISGHVQGVWYRESARRQAEQLGITGWIKNTNDGSVELTACGQKRQLQTFIDWLWQGPEAAQVDDVQWQEITLEQFSEFKVVR